MSEQPAQAQGSFQVQENCKASLICRHETAAISNLLEFRRDLPAIFFRWRVTKTCADLPLKGVLLQARLRLLASRLQKSIQKEKAPKEARKFGRRRKRDI